ncbi:MAG TPA: hypothetical protein IAC45_02420, partial [Candidatus Aphodousia faecavium]|nr:hypothetical protein [Candidatus Aphodousia faecavium]
MSTPKFNKKKSLQIICLAIALVTLHVLVYALKISEAEITYGYQSLISPDNMQELKQTVSKSVLTASILSIPLLWGLFYFFYSTLKSLKKNELKSNIPIGLILSIALIFGTNLYITDELMVVSTIQTIIHILELTPLTTVFIIKIFRVFPKINSFFITNRVINDLSSFFLRKTFLKLFTIFFVSWGSLLLFVYPGIYATDAAWQYDWYIKGQISAHHPPLHTIWLGACIEFGRQFLNSVQEGLFIYTLSQLAVCSCLMAYFYTNIKEDLPRQYFSIFILLTALIPFNALIVLLASKDAVFSMLFINCCAFFYQIAKNNDLLRNPYFLVKFLFFSILMCLFRNNGVYALAIGTILMCFIIKSQ